MGLNVGNQQSVDWRVDRCDGKENDAVKLSSLNYPAYLYATKKKDTILIDISDSQFIPKYRSLRGGYYTQNCTKPLRARPTHCFSEQNIYDYD